MKNFEIDKLKDIADKEIMNSLFMTDLSLMNGQMGIAIFFAMLSRFFDNKYYEEFAEELLDNICNNMSAFLPINFAKGLCGIGWGIEFLKYLGFINDDTDELLSEIDYAVMQRDPRRIDDLSFELGLEGIISYVYCRINSIRNIHSRKPFDPYYISELNEKAKKCGMYVGSNFSIPMIWEKCLELYFSSVDDSWKKAICNLSVFNV